MSAYPCIVRVARTDPDGQTWGETWVCADPETARYVVSDRVHCGSYACASTVRAGFDDSPIVFDPGAEMRARALLTEGRSCRMIRRGLRLVGGRGGAACGTYRAV